ncbi:hypothetical protein SYNPS1DRAFT_26456 [Syncephalis pseudoplumigaleata]|uniref:Uncharacterized protein n=1 Tax=Syncephalis pseudoplumigaleata TaxID=1712513 RepID=A0A4P9Z5M7_9FUNG|nr:hypothetical protein SYNPS1DRAFT_26456 [Syncephalis pseudoplumigaleata]|eukprot:RKP27927.1 hypothetical protein SYNPS1DRAFT_26456 [Syncephalis pseudoplumigaleata]
MSVAPALQEIFERIKKHPLTPQEEATLVRIRERSIRNVTIAGILGLSSGILYARRRQFRPLPTCFFAGFAGMMGVQFGTMLSGWMAKREIEKLPDSKRFIQIFKEARDEMLNERFQRHQPFPSDRRHSGPDAIMRGASIDRDESEHAVTFGSPNDVETAPTRAGADDASTWQRVRAQNKPESAWDRLRAQQHQRPQSQQQQQQQQEGTLPPAWSETQDASRGTSTEESFPRSREDFEQVRGAAGVRRNQYGDIIE